MAKMVKLTLPEFAFLDDQVSDNPGELEGRYVILHVRSASVVEIFNQEDVVLNEDVVYHKFKYENRYGVFEPMTAALHYSMTLKDNIDIKNMILIPCAKWYCKYLDWLDKKIEL